MATLLKKISVKECTGLTPEQLKATAEKGEVVLKIAGTIEGIIRKATQYGEAIGFTGDFVAQNNGGEQFSANTMYMPDKNAVEQFLSKIESVKNDGGSVQFSGEAVVVKSKGDKGYAYIFRPISTVEKAAKQNELFALLGSSQPAQIEQKKAVK